jgi:hypothetical protein
LAPYISLIQISSPGLTSTNHHYSWARCPSDQLEFTRKQHLHKERGFALIESNTDTNEEWRELSRPSGPGEALMAGMAMSSIHVRWIDMAEWEHIETINCIPRISPSPSFVTSTDGDGRTGLQALDVEHARRTETHIINSKAKRIVEANSELP